MVKKQKKQKKHLLYKENRFPEAAKIRKTFTL
jgi:hypothetical protein